jgi:thiamine pyrophosphate-dependent acetolactate synthase large subunit-like protein
MVDVIKALGIEYVALNPGSSFEGLHESLINYGSNSPEILTCTHEESAVAMAHGYYKIEGKPMLALLHGTIGIQHGSMSVYNAYCDRVPVLMIAGLDYDGPVPAHNANDMAAPVRDYVKWDNQPDSLAQFGQSLVRAYKLAMTPPLAPALVVMTARLQNTSMTQVPPVPNLVMPTVPCGDLASVRVAARMLLLIRLFQQTAIGSMYGCLDRDFPKAYGSFNRSLPPKKHASNIWPPVAGRMGLHVRSVETDAPMN